MSKTTLARHIVLLLAASLLGLALALGLAARFSLRLTESKIDEQSRGVITGQASVFLYSLAEEQAANVREQLESWRRLVPSIAARLAPEPPAGRAPDLAALIPVSALDPGYSRIASVYFVTPDGTASVHPFRGHRLDAAEVRALAPGGVFPDWFPRIVGDAASWSGLHADPFFGTNETVVDIVVPAFSGSELRGYIAISLPVNSMCDSLNIRPPIRGGYSFIIDESGRLISTSSQGRVELSAPREPALAAFLERMALGDHAVEPAVVLGSPKVLSCSPVAVQGLPWRLGLCVPEVFMTATATQLTTTVHNSATQALFWMLSATVIFAAVSLWLAVLRARRLAAPISSIAAVATRISEGDLGQRVPERSSMEELEVLARAFNAMTTRLSSAIAGLEDRVALRTAELEKSTEAAEAANRAKSVFLANMSHELRTPLNAILGYSQIMLRDRAPGDPDAETLRIINRSGEHLLGLINSVLDLAKIESHKYSLEPEDFDLGEFVRELVDILRQRAEDKGLSLTFDQTSSFPRYVRLDRNKLRQVLINLMGNAIKFTQTGGVSLRLTTGGSARPDGSGELVFAISDTGPGIHPEDMDRIFRPFEQAAHRPKVEGTGLGLALARELVRLMGGNIRVESEPGRGSTFTFTIAFARVDAESLEKLQLPPLGEITAIRGAEDYRLLIVEDQLENRLMLRRLLERFGFKIAEAENGEAGVRLAVEWKPHLVFMDRRMPVMDGVTAMRKIRALPDGAKIKIVAVTAEAFHEDYDSMMAAGGDAFIRKPYKIGELLETLGALLPVTLVRAQHQEPGWKGGEAGVTARAAFTKLPAEVVAALQTACDSADSEKVSELLTRFPEAAAAAEPFLRNYRTDLLAAELPGE